MMQQSLCFATRQSLLLLQYILKAILSSVSSRKQEKCGRLSPWRAAESWLALQAKFFGGSSSKSTGCRLQTEVQEAPGQEAADTRGALSFRIPSSTLRAAAAHFFEQPKFIQPVPRHRSQGTSTALPSISTLTDLWPLRDRKSALNAIIFEEFSLQYEQ